MMDPQKKTKKNTIIPFFFLTMTDKMFVKIDFFFLAAIMKKKMKKQFMNAFYTTVRQRYIC